MAFPGVSLYSLNGANRTFVPVGGGLQVAPPGNGIFTDSFDGTVLDTVYRWNAPVVAGAGAIAVANGILAATVGTGASAAAAVSTQETYSSQGQGFIAGGSAVFMEAAPATNTHRFLGLGTPNPSYTAATPLQDAVGWEYDITGSLNACIYGGGVRLFKASFPVPSGGIPTVLAFYFRGDAAYFFINNPEEPVAFSPLVSPNIATLPYRFHLINHTAGPTVAPTWSTTLSTVIDTANNFQLTFNGQALSRTRSPGKFVSANALSIATETTVWTPATGRRFRLMGYQLSSTGAQNIVLKDNTAGSTILVIPGVTVGQLNFSPPLGNGILSVAPNNVLTANAGGANTISGYFFGTEE